MSSAFVMQPFEVDAKAESAWQRRLKRGRKYREYVEPARELARLKEVDRIALARSPGDRLTPAEIEHLTAFQTAVQDKDYRVRYFRDTPLEETLQGLIEPMLDMVLASGAEVRTVVNIGCNYAFFDHHLATKHTGIAFHGLDFPANLVAFNADFARDNLTFHPGYPMDTLEQGDIKPDVAFFSSTANEVKNSEVRRYLRVLAELGTRFILLNESLYSAPAGFYYNPDEVPLGASEPVYYQPAYVTELSGPVCRVHNYRAMLDEAGYDVKYYRIFTPGRFDVMMHQVIGERSA